MARHGKVPLPTPPPADLRSLSGDERIADVLAAHPRAEMVLLAYGMCGCCGGDGTLQAGAEFRGIPLEALLEDLRGSLSDPPR